MLTLTIPKDSLSKHILFLWFILSVVALAFSGVYSFLPIVLRAPFLAEFFQLKDFFKVSLVVHVNLAVLVWFLSSSAMLMNLVIKEVFAPVSFTSFITAMIGSVFMAASPFVGAAEPVLNNYIPILHNLCFIIGISLFLSAIFLQVIITILSYARIKDNLINFSIFMSALIFLVAAIAFVKSVLGLKIIAATRFIDLIEYYELLFWGAGHILQFSYIELIVIVWLTATAKLCPSFSPRAENFFALQWLNFVLIITSLIIYWLYPLDSAELNIFFTLHMKYVGGILATIVAIWCSYYLLKNYRKTFIALEFTAFWNSLFLILTGGIIGYLISEINVTIPAHYHGVIIGITVGLMGLFYLLLPKLGFRAINNRAATIQMLLYTVGQFIHITALAISGGYGVLRKTPGAEMSMKAKLYMGIMGVGGIIALAGGILFIILIFKHMRPIKEEK